MIQAFPILTAQQPSKPVQNQPKKADSNDRPSFMNELSKQTDVQTKPQENDAPKAENADANPAQPNEAADTIDVEVTAQMLALMQVFIQNADVPTDAVPAGSSEAILPPSTTADPVAAVSAPTLDVNALLQTDATVIPTTASQVPVETVPVNQLPVDVGTKAEKPMQADKSQPVIPVNQDAAPTTKEAVVVTAADTQISQVASKVIPTQTAPVAQDAKAVSTAQVADLDKQSQPLPTDTVKVTNQADTNSDAGGDTNSDSDNQPQSFREILPGKTLVKISDSASQLDSPKVIAPQAQLADSIKTNLAQGKTEFEIQLTPHNLGKISVKLTSEQGVLRVEFVAENPKTQAMLLANSGEIRDLIQGNTTQTVVTANHSENLPQNYTQQENQNNQQQEQPQPEPEKEAQPEDATTVDFLAVLQQLKEQSRLAKL